MSTCPRCGRRVSFWRRELMTGLCPKCQRGAPEGRALASALVAFLIAGGGALLIYWAANAWHAEGPPAAYRFVALLLLALMLATLVATVAITGLVLGIVAMANRRERQGFPVAGSLAVLLNLLVMVMLLVVAGLFFGGR